MLAGMTFPARDIAPQAGLMETMVKDGGGLAHIPVTLPAGRDLVVRFTQMVTGQADLARVISDLGQPLLVPQVIEPHPRIVAVAVNDERFPALGSFDRLRWPGWVSHNT